MDGFIRMRAALADASLREKAVDRYIGRVSDGKRPELAEQLRISAARALGLFAGVERVKPDSPRAGGWQAIADFMEVNVPQAERERAGTVLVRILNDVLFELLNLSREKAGQPALPAEEKSQTFLTQAVLAISDSAFYPAPMALMLTDFKQVQASVFQVARAPGKNVVLPGLPVADHRHFLDAVRAGAQALGLADAGGRRIRRNLGHHGVLGQPQDHGQRPRIRAPQVKVACHRQRQGDGVMTTTTLTLNDSWLSRRNAFDWIFAMLVLAGGAFVFSRYSASMDYYEKPILVAAMAAGHLAGWFWRPLRVLALVVAAASLLAISSYQGDLARADTVFQLKYFLSSQSAILWMSVLFFMSTMFYWLGLFGGKQGDAMELIGSRIAWVAVTMALVGTMVRWYESHQLGPDIGHIPVSNLYEVFVLFCWITTAFYLYFESRYKTRSLGAFVMLVVSAAVGFLLWYTLVRDAQEIQPLVPALQSWWMKLHVPANFIGYGTFSLAAMVAFAYLIKQQAHETRLYKLTPICCSASRCALCRWPSAAGARGGRQLLVGLCGDFRR